MNKHRFFTVVALALLLVVSSGQAGFCDPWQFDEISQGPGFRDVWNRYTYTQVYYEGDTDSDDAVYFGTYNQRTPASGVSYGVYDEVNSIPYGNGIPPTNVSKGGRIYKYKVSTGQWSLVWPNDDNLSDFDTDNFGMRISQVYNGKIYFGTYHTGFSGGAQLIVIDPANDDSVTTIEPTSNLSAWNSIVSIRALAVYEGQLYIGTEGGIFPKRAQLWSYNEIDGFDQKFDWTNGPFNIAIMEVYGGYLYFGTWFEGGFSGAGLYRGYMSGENFITDEIDLGSAAGDEGVMDLEVFDNKLFVGTADRVGFGHDGFSLLYYDGVDDPTPTILTTTGFDDETEFGPNGYAWYLKTCGGLLFLGVYTERGGYDAGFWATGDGDNWSNLTGFYDPTSTEYGVRSLSCGSYASEGQATAVDRLFYGTAANQASPSTPRFTEATRIFRIEGPFTALPATP